MEAMAPPAEPEGKEGTEAVPPQPTATPAPGQQASQPAAPTAPMVTDGEEEVASEHTSSETLQKTTLGTFNDVMPDFDVLKLRPTGRTPKKPAALSSSTMQKKLLHLRTCHGVDTDYIPGYKHANGLYERAVYVDHVDPAN